MRRRLDFGGLQPVGVAHKEVGLSNQACAGGANGRQVRLAGPEDLHPEGYTVVSDLLIGVAADNWLANTDDTLEIDILIIAEAVTVTQNRMNDMLSQAQEL